MPGRLTLRLSLSARRDIRQAIDYYEAAGSGLGNQFVHQLVLTLDLVADHPDTFQVVSEDVRRALLRQFPYGVFFRQKNELLRIIAVVDLRRHPRTWQRRS